MSSPSPVSAAGPEHVGPEHPEVADHLAAGALAVPGDPGPDRELAAQHLGLPRVPPFQLGPGLLAPALLLRQQLRYAGPVDVAR